VAAVERAEFPRPQRPSSGPVEPAYDGQNQPVELRERALGASTTQRAFLA
jgi:hypothetical protein